MMVTGAVSVLEEVIKADFYAKLQDRKRYFDIIALFEVFDIGHKQLLLLLAFGCCAIMGFAVSSPSSSPGLTCS